MLLKERVKHFRRLNGFSQDSLSEKSGLSIRTIQRIENGTSDGSPHTISSIAIALGVKNEELLESKIYEYSPDVLKWMNLSCLLVILVPLSNIILPFFIYFKNRSKIEFNDLAKKIISFQILWSFCTLLLMIVIPIVLSLLFEMFRGSRIPLYVLVYFITVIVNVFIILKTANKLSSKKSALSFAPNLL